jgi:hypothetical protein
MLTRERLISLLSYDKETGVFRWIFSKGAKKAGSIAGTIRHDRTGNTYRQIYIDYKPYPEHRLAWLYMTGEFPKDQTDHIDGNTLNNKISNLRDVDNSENQKNSSIGSNNTSGVMGVSWSGTRKKWIAYISVNGVRKTLGSFEDIEKAATVRKQAEIKYGFHANHGRLRKQADALEGEG